MSQAFPGLNITFVPFSFMFVPMAAPMAREPLIWFVINAISFALEQLFQDKYTT